MEKWELQIQDFPDAPDPRRFIKALQTASDVLKVDLADFETERLFETLLQSPVSLLNTILAQHQEETWSNAIIEAFRLIGSVGEKYQDVLDPYFDNIVKLCQLPLPGAARRAALCCLRALAQATPRAAAGAARFAAELEHATTCRTELALLVGTLCEYHPEVLEHQASRIWRTYLSLLSSSGLTDKLTSSLLEGAAGSLASFGRALPVSELWQFYDVMRRLLARCPIVCISILGRHSSLFKERIAEDEGIRAILWSKAKQDGVTDALIGVYDAVAEVKKDNMKTIIEKEIIPHLSSGNKLPALTVMSSLRGRGFGSQFDLESHVDVQDLEFELRCADVSYYTADLIIWYIRSGQSDSLRLSHTAVVFHRNLPLARVNDLAAAILANTEIREETITFLASECSQPSLDSTDYMPLWRKLLVDAGSGQDRVAALHEYLGYVADVLQCWLEGGTNVLPDKLSSLLRLTTDILSDIPTPYDISQDMSWDQLSASVRRCPAPELLSVAAAVLDAGGRVQDDVWPYVSVERCRDELSLCACCLLLLHAPHTADSDNVLKALQIIFSRNDVEDRTLLRAVQKLEALISDGGNVLDDADVNKTIFLVRKLQKRTNMAEKDARILQRHVTMFLGKYGGKVDVNNNESEASQVSVVTSKLRDSLSLALPLLEGERVKINLQEILKLAIEEDDPEALTQLLKIICASLGSRRDPSLQSALSILCVSLCRAMCRGDTDVAGDTVRHAMSYCDSPAALHELMTLISSETSPGVRRTLCAALSASDELVASALSRAEAMMGARGTIKLAGLDLIDALIPSIEDNHLIIKKHLPSILDSISQTNLLEALPTFENAKKLFIQRLALFNNEEIDSILKLLIVNALVRTVDKYNIKTYKHITEMSIQIAKEIRDEKKIDDSRIVEIIFDAKERDFFKTLYVLAVLRNKFEFESSFYSSMFFDKSILDDLYGISIFEESNFELEAILVFMKEYADTLLEFNYEKTTQLLSSIIRDISPQQIINHDKSLKECLSTYKNILKYYPKVLEDSFEYWLTNLTIPQIQDIFIEEYQYINIKALNIYLDVTGFYLHSFMDKLKMWPKYVLRKYTEGATGAELSFLTDCLTVAVKVTGFDVKRILLEGKSTDNFVGLKFCAKFMKVFLDLFLRKPYILLDEDSKDCCIILDEVVKFCIKRQCSDAVCMQVLDLVNELWPVYESKTNFQQKYQLLNNLSCLPKSLGRESNPMVWVSSQLNKPNRENSTRLIGVLPGGDEFVDCHTNFAANCLGASLSECPAATLRALYDALAARPSAALLNIAAVLADTDEDIQDKWWEAAMDACCASLAQHNSFDACYKLLALGAGSSSLGVCRRLMLPLLRYSTASYCQQFFSRHLTALLSSLSQKPRDARAADKYRQCIVERTRALLMLEVAFEKIPLSELESPQSKLYDHMDPRPTTSNYITWTVCKLCVTLRREECPSAALRDCYRRYQCAIYSCLCAAICKTKPADKFYSLLVGPDTWGKIEDPEEIYHIPIVKRRRKTRHCVSIPVNSTGVGIGTRTGTAITTNTVFLRTLSEHPHKFDLYPKEVEQVEIQELEMPDSPLNKHSLAPTITALLTHAHAQPCWSSVCAQLTELRSWLVAQCICNSRLILSPHASSLRPALLAFAASTLLKGPMNGLHVDILETLSQWRDDPSLPESSLPHLQTTINALITEAIDSRDPFLQILDSFLEVYSTFVTVDWSVFEPHFQNRASRCLPVIQKIIKHKIHIPQLVESFLKIDLKMWLGDIKIAECFGAALSCERERDGAIQSFRDMLKRVKQSESYIKLLYYAQLGCEKICDAVNFRQVTDQTRKLPKTLQNKCLHILSTYLSQQPIDYSTSMFLTIELSEFLTIDNVEALGLVANGLRFMEESFKRRVVKQALEYCGHSMERVRKAAFKVAAKAFEELFQHTNPREGEPSAKRVKRSNITLLNIMDETDPYVLNVVSKVAAGVTSHIDDVTSIVRKVLRKNPGDRLVECLYLLIAGNMTNMSACAPLLETFFAELRANEHFVICKLRDEPLAVEPNRASKLLTDAKSCRGTLLSYRVSGARWRAKTTDTKSSEIDVQVSLDSILEALLQFAKRQPLAGAALLVQSVASLGLKCESLAAPGLLAALATPGGLTPLYWRLARLVAVRDAGLEEVVLRLVELSSGSDDAALVHCLYEEAMMKRGAGLFELRSAPMPDHDVTMENTSFSIQDLTSCFGRLSNWDDLTIQQRASKLNGLPKLWTDDTHFKAALVGYRASSLANTWFDKLLSSYDGDTKDSARWLSDVRKWPRKRFDESAVAEALSWQLDADPWPCEISPKDCLVEWSARLMIRAVQASEREAIYPSRSNELLWCMRANEMGLHKAVLQCCDRNNIGDLSNEEKISWYHQKLLSLRGMALEKNDSNLLREAVGTAVDLVTNLPDQTASSIAIYKLIFLLKQNLNELTTNDVNDILKNIIVNRPTEPSKRVLTSLYELALIHYDTQRSDDTSTQDEVIKNLSFTLHHMRESNLGPNDKQVALLLNRLNGYSAERIVNDDVRNKILEVFNPHPHYDDFTTQHISSTLNLLGVRASESCDEYKKLFATIRDVGYCLMEYCKVLAKGVGKKDIWCETFTKIKNMMENPYVGSDYHLLTAQKNKLYAIADFDSTTSEAKLEVLRSVMVTLDVPPRSGLRVSQLCPALAKRELALPGAGVVAVEDQVTVITDSIRRPCILTFLTSHGNRIRYMHKCGEPLSLDAGVLRVCPDAQYRVIPTSEDSGLIQYLEGHETLYSMISSVCDLDEISASVQRPNDDELIMTPSPHTFKQLREKVPIHALRSALERNSSCVEDFLMKKRNFQDSLATTAIFDWILGIGDRHLQNIICSMYSGRLVGIDSGAALTYTRELPPARLSACLLACTDIQVLESRLQSTLSQYRNSAYIFCNFLKITFNWYKPHIDDKLPHIQALVTGRCLSHHISRNLVERSKMKYKEAYLKLFDEVFEEFEDKDQYSVVEQISCFLLHCTSPRILQVTRAGWTPWV